MHLLHIYLCLLLINIIQFILANKLTKFARALHGVGAYVGRQMKETVTKWKSRDYGHNLIRKNLA